jgi:hypothetical protein
MALMCGAEKRRSAMKIGALVLGIIGGLVALLYGVIGYGLGSLADVGEAGAGAGLKIVSLGLPIAALVGAGMVMAKPIIGAALMGIAAVGLVLILGFNFCLRVRLPSSPRNRLSRPKLRIETILEGRSQSTVHEARLCARLCGIGVLLRVGLFWGRNLDRQQGLGETGALSMLRRLHHVIGLWIEGTKIFKFIQKRRYILKTPY